MLRPTTEETEASATDDQVMNDPLVHYLEYVIPEVRKRSEVSAYLLTMAVDALREGSARLPASH